MTEIILRQERTFRRTPGVHFADITVPNSNGIDLVEHTGPSTSPADKDGRRCWYVHKHQTDNNRVVHGVRLFELFNPKWMVPHWYVLLDENSGALEIPPGCFHRSHSGNGGSLLLNHAVRDEEYDESKEFDPCHCPAADKFPVHCHGITTWAATTFINHGELN